MKRKIVFWLAIVLFGLQITYTACSNANAKGVDVVNGTTPVNQNQWRTDFNNSLKPMTMEQRVAEVERVKTHLNSQLIEALRQRGLNCKVTSISYVFGSGTAKGVESGDTKSHDGYFNDQLYAVVKGEKKCFSDSLMVFVQCLNGTFLIKGESTFSLGTFSPVFTIEKGWGFNHYVDYETSIWIAEQFGKKIHQGQGWEGKVITPEYARSLKDELSRNAVTVECYPGDIIDLGQMTYNGQPAKQ